MNSGKISINGLIVSLSVIVIVIASIYLKPKYENYVKEQRCKEAGLNIRKIYDGQVTYYQELKYQKKVVPHFISAPSTPKGNPGKERREGNWDHPAWKKLKFNPGEPVWFSYATKAKGTGNESSFTVWAIGDVDGDGETSFFERKTKIETETGEILGGAGLYKIPKCD